jgi:hypothetical protein
MIRKSVTICAAAAALFTAGYWFGMTNTAHAQSSRVFELRTYTTLPGKLPDLQKRFREHTLDIFKRHGMTNVAYWTPEDKPLSENTLIYVISHESRDAAKKSWDDFRNDPEWKKVSAASEENGKIVDHVVSVFMDPTDYSPMK